MLSPNPLGSADDAASLKVLAQTKTSAALLGAWASSAKPQTCAVPTTRRSALTLPPGEILIVGPLVGYAPPVGSSPSGAATA